MSRGRLPNVVCAFQGVSRCGEEKSRPPMFPKGLRQFRLVKEMAPGAAFSLDIGCKDRPLGDVAVDIDLAARPTVVADAGALPFKEAAFGRVYLLETIEHFPKGSETQALAEIRRVLKENGELLISTPHDIWLYTLTDPAYWLMGHRHYRKEPLAQMVEKAGFAVEECFVTGGLWNWLLMLFHYFVTFPFRIKEPAFLWAKADEEYQRGDPKGDFAVFVRAAKRGG